MTIQEIFDLALQMGIAADPRGIAGVTKYLERKKKAYDSLSEKKKQYFDKESLTNPFADSGVLVGNAKKNVKRVMVGIDMNIGEVLLADRLADKGQPIDAIITHHPEGAALSALHEVMDLQVDMLADLGVPITTAEQLMQPRIDQIRRRLHPVNHAQAIDAAKLLDLPIVALHTIWDNMGHTFLQDYLDKKPHETVGDVFDAIMEIPEFQEATHRKEGPYIGAGSEKNRAGKVVVGFTGGTEPDKSIYEHMARAGIGTLVDMHMHEENIEAVKKHHMNLIVTGHMASDSIGGNLFFDALEKKGIEIVPVSGFIRVRR